MLIEPRIFSQLDATKLPGMRHSRTFFEKHFPRARWNIGGRVELGVPFLRHVAVDHPASLYRVGLRAAQLFHHFIPWEQERLTVKSPFRLMEGQQVDGVHLIGAALLSPMRYLAESPKLAGDYYRALQSMKLDPDQVHSVLSRVVDLRALQGMYSELKEETDRLQHELDYPEDSEDSGEFHLPSDSGKSRGRRKSDAQIERERKMKLEFLLQQKRSSIALNKIKLADFKKQMSEYRLPTRLLAAAIDLANLDHIAHAPPNDQLKYFRRVRNFHAPLLHRLGFHVESQRLQDQAMERLNRAEFVKLGRDLGQMSHFREGLGKDLEKFVSHYHLRQGLLSDSRMIDRTKGIYSTYQKLNEPADPQTGLTGLQKYNNDVANIHDALSFRIVHSGDQIEDVECLRDHLLKSLTGRKLGAFRVSDVSVKRDWLRHPKEGSGYQSAHLIVELEPERALDEGKTHPKKIEIQLVNEHMDAENSKGFANHAHYKGDEPPPEVDEFVPPEGVHDFMTVEVHGPDGGERRLHPLPGDTVQGLLASLGSQVGVTPDNACLGHTAVYAGKPDEKGKNRLDLLDPVQEGVTYHVVNHVSPVPVRKRTLINMKQMDGLDLEWQQAAREAIWARQSGRLTPKQRSRKPRS